MYAAAPVTCSLPWSPRQEPERSSSPISAARSTLSLSYANCSQRPTVRPAACTSWWTISTPTSHHASSMFWAPVKPPRCCAGLNSTTTPKHAIWLNMAEIEIGVLTRQCLNTRVDAPHELRRNVQAWQQRRNRQARPIKWTFTKQKADKKLGRHYVS